MPTIAEVRQQYPQYSDMSDEALASALHKKYYADMPFDAFADKIGLVSQKVNTDAKSGPDSYSGRAILGDVGRQTLQGLKNAATGLVGLPGDIANLAGDAAAGWSGILGKPEMADAAKAAGSRFVGAALNPASLIYGNQTQGGLNNMAAKVMGPDVDAQTWQGRLAGNTAEMTAGAIGPGGLVRKAAQVALPGVASFAAGEATEGSSIRPFAKAGAALAGGIGASGLGNKQRVIDQALSKTRKFASQEELNAEVDRIYQTVRDAGITFNADDFGRMAGTLGKKLADRGIMQIDAPMSWARVDDILQGAQAGRRPAWTEIDSMRSGLGDLMRTGQGKERKAASIIFKELDRFEKQAGMTSDVGMSKLEMLGLTRRGRDLALRNIKAKEFIKREGRAENYLSGIESGLRNQTKNMLNSKYGETLFRDKNERSLIQDVTAGGPIRKALTTAGRAGFDWSRFGNLNALGPLLATTLPAAAGGAYGYSTGDWKSAAAILAAGSLAKVGARKLTERDARRALNVILSGPKDLRAAYAELRGAQRDALLRLVLTGTGTVNAARE